MIFIYGEKYFFMEFGEYTTIFMHKCLGPIFFMETPPGSGFLARNRPFYGTGFADGRQDREKKDAESVAGTDRLAR
jgi:hypothetical protein